jgi:hypothetical protein
VELDLPREKPVDEATRVKSPVQVVVPTPDLKVDKPNCTSYFPNEDSTTSGTKN